MKIYKMQNTKILLLLPLVLAVVNLLIGGSFEMVNIMSWFLGGIIITVGFGLTIVVDRIELSKDSVKKVFAFRSKTIKLSGSESIEVNDKYIFIRSVNSKVLMLVSRKLMNKDEFNGLTDDLRKQVDKNRKTDEKFL